MFIHRLDIYRKVPQDLTEPTLSGAIISLLCVSLIIILFFVELRHFLAQEMYVLLCEFYVTPTFIFFLLQRE